ncbi:unnamed protein product [Fructobacillus fructosus]|uniref:Uncharacterized protein n=1 Tax=Fructobacillus fructosus TaxID=1631 RepID=A0ABN9YW18_9LACO|nr:unnamed protein product [Fructobacillus fructosus]
MTDKQIKTTTHIFGIINVILTPFVFMTMWNWYVTQLGAPHVGYLLSFGIVLLIDFVIYIPSSLNKLTYQDSHEAIEFRFKNAVGGTTMIVWTLVIGMLIHLFM